MSILEIILAAVLWIAAGTFALRKQDRSQPEDMPVEFKVFIVMFAPLYLVGAMIRQTFFEDWR